MRIETNHHLTHRCGVTRADAAERLITSLSELAQHIGGGEGEQFSSDLRRLVHNSIDQFILPNADRQQVLEFQHEVVALLDAWIISMCLDGSPEWHRQVDDVTEALLGDELSYFGNPMTTDELHHFGACWIKDRTHESESRHRDRGDSRLSLGPDILDGGEHRICLASVQRHGVYEPWNVPHQWR